MRCSYPSPFYASPYASSYASPSYPSYSYPSPPYYPVAHAYPIKMDRFPYPYYTNYPYSLRI